MPIKSINILFSKIIYIYIKSIIVNLLVILPVVSVIRINFLNSNYLIVLSILVSFLLPFITIALVLLTIIPFQKFRNKISSKYVLNAVLFILFLAIFLTVYYSIIEKIEKVAISGEIRYIFDEKAMMKIAKACSFLFPGKLIADIVIGNNSFLNLAYFVMITLPFAFAGILLIDLILNKSYIKDKNLHESKRNNKNIKIPKKRGLIFSLVKKEVLSIVYTPDYVYQYLSTVVLMPLITFFAYKIIIQILSAFFMLNIQKEIVLLILCLYGALVNIFCATNISRDGNTLFTIKTMPISFRKYIYIKVLFSFFVLLLAQLITIIIFLSNKILTLNQSIIILVISAFLSLAQICFATRRDLSNITIDNEKYIKTANNSKASGTILIGIIGSLIIGFFTVYINILIYTKNLNIKNRYIILIDFFISLVLMLLSFVYLNLNLANKVKLIAESK